MLPGRGARPYSFTRLRLDHDLRRGAPRTLPLQPVADTRGDLAIDLRVRSIRIGRDHGSARVGGLADCHVQRHLAEERHAEFLRFLVRAAVTENVVALAALRT